MKYSDFRSCRECIRDEPRNDAEDVFDRLFGDSEGWDERVAAATDAVLLAEEVYALRERHGLSQRALAKLINSSQSAIARLEDATYRGHSISVLRRIAAAVGEQVIVRFMATTGAGKRPGSASRKRPARAAKSTMRVLSGSGSRKPTGRRQGAQAEGRKVTA